MKLFSFQKLPQFLPVDCQINENVRKNIGLPSLHQSIKCISTESKNEVYVPFTFIKKYFDVRRIVHYLSIKTKIILVNTDKYSSRYTAFCLDHL